AHSVVEPGHHAVSARQHGDRDHVLVAAGRAVDQHVGRGGRTARVERAQVHAGAADVAPDRAVVVPGHRKAAVGQRGDVRVISTPVGHQRDDPTDGNAAAVVDLRLGAARTVPRNHVPATGEPGYGRLCRAIERTGDGQLP